MVRNAAADFACRRFDGGSNIACMERYSAAGLGAPAWDSAELIWSLSTWEARKTKTRRGWIGTSVPVLGLRPTRLPFLRTVKLPNDEILTISLRASALAISFRTVSTSMADSLRERPTSW